MIAIVNIEKDVKSDGPHLYEVRINFDPKARFYHNREDDLATCLRKAADAVEKEKLSGLPCP